MAIPMYDIRLTPGDVDFLRELVDFAEDILDAVDMQDAMREEGALVDAD